MNSIRVAVIQDSPVLFNLEATLAKIEHLISKTRKKQAQLVLFPEAFIPAYPRGLGFGTVVGSRSDAGRNAWQHYWENALQIPSPFYERLAQAAKSSEIFLAIGVIEKEEGGGSLYCTLLIFGPDGKLIGKHRKLKPTGQERIIWGEGDGNSLKVYETAIGKVGGLICWENYMPLARMALYDQGIQLYLAPTADHRPSWQSSLIHIATEGRCFVLGCNQFVKKEEYPKIYQEELSSMPEIMSRGGSTIIGPLGNVLVEPVYDRADILYADLNLEETSRAKMDLDVCGHYARPDILNFSYPNQKKSYTL